MSLEEMGDTTNVLPIIPPREGDDIMGHLTDDALFELRKRASMDLWIHNVEDILVPSESKQVYIDRLNVIDAELRRRGYNVPA